MQNPHLFALALSSGAEPAACMQLQALEAILEQERRARKAREARHKLETERLQGSVATLKVSAPAGVTGGGALAPAAVFASQVNWPKPLVSCC